MENLFITQHFDWDPAPSRKLQWINRILSKLGVSTRLSTSFSGHMTTIEQRINLFHLLSQVLAFNVPGDIVEIGTHEGMTAVLFMSIAAALAPKRQVHLFDAFENPTEETVLANVSSLNLPRPVTHRGLVHESLPDRLPPQIAFFNIDIGPGRSPNLLESDIIHALSCAYGRMSEGAIGVMQDYCDPDAYKRPGYRFPNMIHSTQHWNHYPQVKNACDKFFQNKLERVYPLYGGNYSHGYFRKGSSAATNNGLRK